MWPSYSFVAYEHFCLSVKFSSKIEEQADLQNLEHHLSFCYLGTEHASAAEQRRLGRTTESDPNTALVGRVAKGKKQELTLHIISINISWTFTLPNTITKFSQHSFKQTGSEILRTHDNRLKMFWLPESNLL